MINFYDYLTSGYVLVFWISLACLVYLLVMPILSFYYYTKYFKLKEEIKLASDNKNQSFKDSSYETNMCLLGKIYKFVSNSSHIFKRKMVISSETKKKNG